MRPTDIAAAEVEARGAPLIRRLRAPLCAAALLTLLCAAGGAGAAGTKLLRFPNIWHDRIVFSYAGDLWSVGSQGGTAARLTAGPGLKLFGKYSPDGRFIAFTGQYGGDEQVYVMPAGGGAPRQLTFYPATGPLPDRWGYDNQVYGWTPDGDAILFRSLRDAHTLAASKLYTVPRDGGPATALAMPFTSIPIAAACSIYIATTSLRSRRHNSRTTRIGMCAGRAPMRKAR